MDTFWLGRLAGLCGSIAIVAGAVALAGSPESPGQRAVIGYLDALDRDLRFIRVRCLAWHLALGQLTLAVGLIFAAAVTRSVLPLPALPAVLVCPRLVLARASTRRVERIGEQIEPWLNAIANALKASASLGEAIQQSRALVQAPIAEEVDVLVKEHELGTPLDRALGHFAERVPSRTLEGAVVALCVARISGGDLPAMLESAAAGLREMARLEGVVRTKTAEGKAQTLVIGVLPLPMVVLIHWIDPGFFVPLREHFTGQLVVAGAMVLWLMSIVSARKILDVDI